jgi:hypothetical protein
VPEIRDEKPSGQTQCGSDCAVGQALRRGPLIFSLDEVARDIDAQHVRSEFRRGQCGRAIAASEIQDLETFFYSESLSRMVAAMRVKSPFSQSALFGFMGKIYNGAG